MRLSLTKVIISSFLLIGILFASSCTEESSATNGNNQLENEQTSATSTPISDSDINPQNFTITENEEGVPVMTGILSSGLTLNARVYCEKDLDKPGTASVDVAELRTFVPADLDKLVQKSWIISNDTSETMKRDGIELEYRTLIYTDLLQHNGVAGNTEHGIYFSRDGLSAPIREPWFSEEFAWQTEDFTFMTGEEAFEMLRDLATYSGVQISNIYQIDRVPSETLEEYYRLRISYGESLPVMQWTKEDDAYSVTLKQDWDGLPVCSTDLCATYDGSSLEGESYQIMLSSKMMGIVTAEGVQNFQVYNVYENISTGEDQDLISLWNALSEFRNHIEKPQYESEIFFRLSTNSNRDLTIDQIELCYVPIWQGEVGTGESAPYDMTPCWIFRVIGYDESANLQIYTGVVNAITGEYILQTNYAPSI